MVRAARCPAADLRALGDRGQAVAHGAVWGGRGNRGGHRRMRAVRSRGHDPRPAHSAEDRARWCGRRHRGGRIMKGKLHLVSVGPGFSELIPPLAESALRESDVVVGYELYLKWIAPWIAGKEIHAPPLTKERERALLAI